MASSPERRALRYLRLEFQPQRDFRLVRVKSWRRSGAFWWRRSAIFRFDSDVGERSTKSYYVVVPTPGATNYYPEWGLTPEQVWNVHMATELLLYGMAASRAPGPSDADHLAQARALVRSELPGAELAGVTLDQVTHVTDRRVGIEARSIVGHVDHGGVRRWFGVGDPPHLLFGVEIHPDAVESLHFGTVYAARVGD